MKNLVQTDVFRHVPTIWSSMGLGSHANRALGSMVLEEE